MTADTISIEPMTSADWPDVRTIYAAGIGTGNATFETSAPAWDVWDRAHLPDHRWIARLDGDVVGWIAASAVSDRCVYDGVVEHSVYVDPSYWGHGVAGRLLDALIASTESAGIWTIQSGIFPENAASLAAHQRHGFRIVGTRERIGRLNGTWRDVVLIERRSARV